MTFQRNPRKDVAALSNFEPGRLIIGRFIAAADGTTIVLLSEIASKFRPGHRPGLGDRKADRVRMEVTLDDSTKTLVVLTQAYSDSVHSGTASWQSPQIAHRDAVLEHVTPEVSTPVFAVYLEHEKVGARRINSYPTDLPKATLEKLPLSMY